MEVLLGFLNKLSKMFITVSGIYKHLLSEKEIKEDIVFLCV